MPGDALSSPGRKSPSRKSMRRRTRERQWAQKWHQAWLDTLAFTVGIAVAAIFGWKTSELVWSLWLSTTVVALTYVVWTTAGRVRMAFAQGKAEKPPWRGLYLLLEMVGTVFWLVFALVFFGAFQLFHSVAVNQYFPISTGTFPPVDDPWVYWRVFKQFWYFLPPALLAERTSFKPWPGAESTTDPQKWAESSMRKVVTNIIRMHLLLLFFALTKPESLFIYSLVYLIYFFPWSLLKRP